MQTIKINSWRCPSCAYTQDFAPVAESLCPSCQSSPMEEAGADSSSYITVREEGDLIEEMQRDETGEAVLDEEGNKVMITRPARPGEYKTAEEIAELKARFGS